ncbi:hypothetical protein PAECIP111892_03069 [Paenibacillus auburnensis]|uniref:Restriction endonuclease type IV Mrr domain-containing protein n=1 Tax=Paenibacillus auburnensis TaxID=2905649 RepID=A0ABN8GKL4_9BACL|nr:hypothetical protein [Paenibacillus auburnensis]CAH1208204.1 hypothetical protein PAECIP111892_03069 [Paenibacillus auburnensis]
MLDITGNDIAELNDSDLRSLIGLLCEAELRIKGLPIAGVTWGGDQNAGDGGIDVRVEVSSVLHDDGFISRSNTGFQVKKPDMPRNAIIEEMRPKNQLRQVIKDLADNKGAYIIVSSQGSTADSALRSRKAAMQNAVADYPNATQLKVDFFDRGRIASWVRAHPSIILWVRQKIGRSIQGWKSYDNWANCPGGKEEAYITDEQVRLYNSSGLNSEALSVTVGINQIRNTLSRPGSSVRLVGLSGVGKTRLVQSLFDERIGQNPLNTSHVFYSDISDSPLPDPRNFAEMLGALQKRIILVIDNCPPDLHRRLTSICSAAGSQLSLLTVEYDVRDDQPEETEVYRLDPASRDLIEEVILNRFAHITQIGARMIAEFAGGNARIAIALAKTIERGEDISQLRDSDLFERLFQQRHLPDNRLLKAAEVCSLVYSFDMRTEAENNELKLLSTLASLDIRELYENIVELKRRELVQQRSYWRAVLPQAIANRLAERALQNIPTNIITDTFLNSGSERLLISFTRRLGFLHNSQTALQISREWLSETGLLGDVMNLNQLGITLLRNIAPVEPTSILSLLERLTDKEECHLFFSRENIYFDEFTRLLRSIAYDPLLFERASHLLCCFALTETPDENNNSIRRLLKSLFNIHLSGTHATPEQRLKIISSLLNSDSENRVDLGLSLLEASLEAWHFTSSYGFEFGARARDYGWLPRSNEDVNHWYKTFLDYLLPLAGFENALASKLRDLLAVKFRGLWTKAAMYDELETVINYISAKHTWNDGWTAVKSTLRFDGKEMAPNVVIRLNNLADILAPITLLDKARLYILSSHKNSIDLIDTIDKDSDLMEGVATLHAITCGLGKKVGGNTAWVDELLPDLLSHEGTRIFDFGKGLSESTYNSENLWANMLKQLYSIPESKRNYQLLRGFLNGLSNTNNELCEKLLDEAITDQLLSSVFPIIQMSINIDKKGLNRIKKALELEHTPVWMYRNLKLGRTLDDVSDNDFCELVEIIASKSEGDNIAIEILHMRIHGIEKGTFSEKIMELGQKLLLQYSFTRTNMTHKDYELGVLVEYCFYTAETQENMRVVADKIAAELENHYFFPTDYDHILKAIALTHPLIFLNVFLLNKEVNYGLTRLISDDIHSFINPMSVIEDDVVLSWCNINPEVRYQLIASVLLPYKNNEHRIGWTPIATTLIKESSNPILVLKQFKRRFRPNSWSGSRADLMERFIPLISQLKDHDDAIVSQWAIQEERTFIEEIRTEREWEMAQDREHDERFE